MRALIVAVCLLSFTGCRDNFDDFQTDPLSADWELQSVEGIVGCTATSGTLQIVEIQNMGFSGDFNWSASCMDGTSISEAGDVSGVEVDERGRDYGVDILLHTPATLALDWDCTMNGEELSCVQSGAAVVIFEFTRQSA